LSEATKIDHSAAAINTAIDRETRRIWLAERYPPLAALLAQMERQVETQAGASDAHLDDASRYVVSGRGKRLRPAVLLMSAEVCGGANAKAVSAAAIIELVHNASLAHDDVLDEASWRRGKPSARALWGNRVSVLLGDYLLCRAISLLTNNGTQFMLDDLLLVIQQMCRGQMAEIFEAGPQLDEARYLEIIADKTAALLGLCGRLGAQSAAAPSAAAKILESFAASFGMAFQIADDIYDLVGSQEVSGKPVNHDLRQKKVTLPLIYARQQSQGTERAFLEKTLGEPSVSEEELAHMRQLAISSGGVNRAWSVCHGYLKEAQETLAGLTAELPSLQDPAADSQSRQAHAALLFACGEGFPLPVLA